MDWEQMLIVLAGIGFLMFVLDKYVPPRKRVDPDEVLNLKAKIAALEQQIDFWKERGDRFRAQSDNHAERIKQLYDQMLTLTPTPDDMKSYRQAILDLRKDSK